MIFLGNVVDEAGEKDPEHIQEYLGKIHVAGNISNSLHGDFSLMTTKRVTRSIRGFVERGVKQEVKQWAGA